MELRAGPKSFAIQTDSDLAKHVSDHPQIDIESSPQPSPQPQSPKSNNDFDGSYFYPIYASFLLAEMYLQY